jgi:hypothetical protein
MASPYDLSREAYAALGTRGAAPLGGREPGGRPEP